MVELEALRSGELVDEVADTSDPQLVSMGASPSGYWWAGNNVMKCTPKVRWAFRL